MVCIIYEPYLMGTVLCRAYVLEDSLIHVNTIGNIGIKNIVQKEKKNDCMTVDTCLTHGIFK